MTAALKTKFQWRLTPALSALSAAAATKTRLSLSMAFSVALHAFALFGIALVLPDPRSAASFLQPLQVVLVNVKSKSRPAKADALAQANLEGGGNTPEDRQARTPLPAIRDDRQFTPEQIARRVAQLEEESKRMLTRLKSGYQVVQPEPRKQQSSDARSGEDLVQKSLEIARLEAQIDKNHEALQKWPKRRYIGSSTREYRFAQYIEDWRIKVERIGNLNYPEQARQQRIFGSLKLSVSINADGSLGPVEVDRSSGSRILDAAAMRIVRLAAPFAPLPPDIRKDTDILVITRTWTFTSTDRLESK